MCRDRGEGGTFVSIKLWGVAERLRKRLPSPNSLAGSASHHAQKTSVRRFRDSALARTEPRRQLCVMVPRHCIDGILRHADTLPRRVQHRRRRSDSPCCNIRGTRPVSGPSQEDRPCERARARMASPARARSRRRTARRAAARCTHGQAHGPQACLQWDFALVCARMTRRRSSRAYTPHRTHLRGGHTVLGCVGGHRAEPDGVAQQAPQRGQRGPAVRHCCALRALRRFGRWAVFAKTLSQVTSPEKPRKKIAYETSNDISGVEGSLIRSRQCRARARRSASGARRRMPPPCFHPRAASRQVQPRAARAACGRCSVPRGGVVAVLGLRDRNAPLPAPAARPSRDVGATDTPDSPRFAAAVRTLGAPCLHQRPGTRGRPFVCAPRIQEGPSCRRAPGGRRTGMRGARGAGRGVCPRPLTTARRSRQARPAHACEPRPQHVCQCQEPRSDAGL